MGMSVDVIGSVGQFPHPVQRWQATAVAPRLNFRSHLSRTAILPMQVFTTRQHDVTMTRKMLRNESQ